MSRPQLTAYTSVQIQTESFDLAREEKALQMNACNAGALVAFQGMVREFEQLVPKDTAPSSLSKPAVRGLFLEHYPGVTEHEIERIMQQAWLRWPFSAMKIIHRVGELALHEPIVLVLVYAEHRAQAFSAAQYVMDYLKTQAPFWKKERFTDESSVWVEAKDSDAHALAQWETRD